MRVPYENLKKANEGFAQDFRIAFEEVLQSGWYILGKQCESFEAEFSKFHDVPFCVGVASGLDALTLALVACDFPKDSEVIVPSNTYIATILSILNAGLKPVMVEPDILTYNIDSRLVAQAVTHRTVALMVVHLYGKICDMDPLLKICQDKKIRLFEDCAQAHNATYRGKLAGTFGDFGCFSFYPTKNLGALGDAGGILCKTQEDSSKLRALRNYGSHVKYYNEYIGTNSRLDELQAAFLKVKLKKMNELTAHKRRLAAIYFDGLDSKKFVLPKRSADQEDVFHIFNIRHPERDRVRQYLTSRGIGTEVHHPVPAHQQKAMRGILQGNYPISEEIHQTTLSLPISFGNSEEDIKYVVECLSAFE